MNNLSPELKDALIKIYNHFIESGNDSFDSAEAGFFSEDDECLSELEENDYIYVKRKVSDTITILDKGKRYVESL